MKRLWLTLPLALLGAWGLGVWLPGNHWASEVPRTTERAERLLGDGEPERSLELLDASQTGRRPGIDTRLATGFAALGTGDVDRARDEFEAALRIEAHSPRAWLGLCLAGGPGTEAACDQAVERSKLEPDCQFLLARAVHRLDTGRHGSAEEDARSCAAIDPDHPMLGSIEARLKGGVAEPLSIPVSDWLDTGSERRRDERHDDLEAIRDLLARDHHRKALSRLDRLDEEFEPGVEATLLRAMANLGLDRRDEATALLAEANEALPAGSRLIIEACVLAADMEAHVQTEELCTRGLSALAVEARCQSAHALGQSRMNRGRWDQAEAVLRPCLGTAADEDGLLWFDAAVTAAARGEIALSIERMRQAAKRDPSALDPAALGSDPALQEWRDDPRGAAALRAVKRGDVP